MKNIVFFILALSLLMTFGCGSGKAKLSSTVTSSDDGTFLESGTVFSQTEILFAQADTWMQTAIGEHVQATFSEEENGSVILRGNGNGFSHASDQHGFLFREDFEIEGDVDIVVRLVSLEGKPGTSAGIALRSGTEAMDSTISVMFTLTDRDTPPKNNMSWAVRGPRADGQTETEFRRNGVSVMNDSPVWLRLIRMGDLFAVYKSSDGRLWVPLGNTSGWRFLGAGSMIPGLFVAGGETSATAVFEHFDVREPSLPWRTSWVGNTFGCRPTDYHVPGAIGSLVVMPDGTCFTSCFWEEGGSAITRIHSDGHIVKNLCDGNELLGNCFAGGGTLAISGDRLFVVCREHLITSDLMGTPAHTRRMDVDSNLFDEKTHTNIISGLATDGNVLFFADPRENRIRVANVSFPRYFTAGNTETRKTDEPVETAGVAGAAPEAVYQSFRFTDSTGYVLPGFSPGRYTLRCHFVQYDEITRPGMPVGDQLHISASGAESVTGFNIKEKAGGFYKAAVLDIPNVLAGEDGNIRVGLHRGPNREHVLICGLEVLDAEGKRVFALNCVGPTVGDFQGESWELPDRAFPFERPGSIVIDKRGDLWILQRPGDYPVNFAVHEAKYPAALKCYTRDGEFTGREITDFVLPTSVAYDAVNDQLLVADNGPEQNIRFYGQLESQPTFVKSFGVPGGLYAGKNPGLLYDPQVGGDTRLHHITAVGIDAEGFIYVNCGMQGTDFRKYSPDGKLVWHRTAILFCNTPDVDPDSDGTEIYSTYAHMRLDLDKTEPGSEWQYVGLNWDTRRFGYPIRGGNSQSILRRLGPERQLIHFTSGQGYVESAKIFRYEGEIAIPCGEIRQSGREIWLDTNGDGLETPDEVIRSETPVPGGMNSFCVDSRGDIWFALLKMEIPSGVLRHFRLLGFTEHGAPRYGLGPGDYEDIPYPRSPTEGGGWANIARVHYDPDQDRMILVGPAETKQADRDESGQYMACYDHWSTERTERWNILLPRATRSPNFMYADKQAGLPQQWMGMDVAGDKIFLANLWGEVNVFDTKTGVIELIISPGPEVAGHGAWEDASQGIRVFQRKNGEFMIFVESSGYGGKCHFYRWHPEKK